MDEKDQAPAFTVLLDTLDEACEPADKQPVEHRRLTASSRNSPAVNPANTAAQPTAIPKARTRPRSATAAAVARRKPATGA